MESNQMDRNIIRRINDGFCYVEKTVVWIAFAIMLSLLLIQVICRYCFHMPLAWAEELIRYSYIGVSFMGAIVATRERSHITIDILPTILVKVIKNERSRSLWNDVLSMVQELVCIPFWTCLSYWVISYNVEIAAQNQITTANEWPMWLMCLPLSISCIMMGLHNLLNLLEDAIDFKRVRTGGVN